MGIFSSTVAAVRKGLARTRETLAGGLRRLVAGRRLDDALISEIESILLKADVGVATTRALIDELRQAAHSGELERGEDAIEHLRTAMKRRLHGVDRALAVAPASPTVILVAGINGAGKTTSVAKIARSLRSEGRSVLLAAADTFRAGAVEQLRIWSERLGIDIVTGAHGADPASVAFDAAEAAVARGADVLLVDTAGRLHTQRNLMDELVKIRRVIAKRLPGAPHEVLLVLDATSGQNAIAQARSFGEAIDVTGIFLAKLDGTAKGGIILAIHDEVGVPVKLVGVGETPEDVEPFDADAFVDAMFE
jgi:fused signal recognition particle receptor